MQTPLFVRPLTADERATLPRPVSGLLSAFTVRRCQILLASAEGQPKTSPRLLAASAAPIRPYVTSFMPSIMEHIAVLQPLSSRPHTTSTIFDAGACEALRALLHQSPRTFWPAHEPVDARARRRGQVHPRSHAAAGQRRNHSTGPASVAGVLEAGQAFDFRPRSGLSPKKKRRTRLIQQAMAHPTWALGFEDEVWWSRLAQPDQHCWTDAEATQKLQELTPPAADPDPKALACYGLLVRPPPPQEEQMWRRFVTGRPVSAVTIAFLAWCCAQLAAQGFTALLLIWDNASWHRSPAVRHWIRQHNQQVKRGAVGVRVVVCPLPSKSPWLNPIEPKWVHGKRAVSEPDRLLSADELEARVYAYYGCEGEVHLVMPKKVA